MVFELAAYLNRDDFTLWNNDGPIIVEIELFSVSAVQGRAPGGERGGQGILREPTRGRVGPPCWASGNSSRIFAKDG